MKTPSLLAFAAVLTVTLAAPISTAGSQPTDTGSVWIAQLTGPTTSGTVTDLIVLELRLPGGGKGKISARAAIGEDATPAQKAAAYAQAINDSEDNTNGDGDDPQHLVRASSMGSVCSFVGQNGVKVKGSKFSNRTRQKGCKLIELKPTSPQSPGGSPGSDVGELRRDHPSFTLYGTQFLGTDGQGDPSEVEVGVIMSGDNGSTIAITARAWTEAGDRVDAVLHELAGQLREKGVESTVEPASHDAWKLVLERSFDGLVWGSSDSAVVLVVATNDG